MSALSNLQTYFSRYGAHLIFLGNDQIKPGQLLNARYPWPFGQTPTFTGEQGFAWDFTKETAANYPSALFEANWIQQEINEKTKISAKASLPQFGIGVDGAYENDFTVAIRLTGVKSRGFVNGISLPTLNAKLLALKKSDPTLWPWVNDDFLVAEAFHVTEFEASFRGEGQITAKGAYEQGGLNISGEFQHEWKNDTTLKANGPIGVPIAVRGVKI